MAIELPRVNKCCCMSLRVGTLIIGYVSIIASLFTIAMVSWSIYIVVQFVHTNKNKPIPDHSPEDLEKTAISLYVSFAFYLVVFLYNLVISIVLVIGAHMNKPRYLRFYFKAAIFLLSLGIALVIVTCVFMGFLITIPVLKWVFILFCCLVIVRSTYLQMEEAEKPPLQYQLQPYYVVQQQPQQVPLMA